MYKVVMTALTAVFVAVLATAFIGCSGVPKVEYKKIRPFPQVFTKGYGWGENAEEIATHQALLEAAALTKPRAIEFTYLRVGPYEMFKTEQVEEIDAKVLGAKALQDGGMVATVQTNRDQEALREMKYMVSANFKHVCKAPTFRARHEKCQGEIYERAMKEFAVRKFGKVPEKLLGNYTFFVLNREDDGKKTLTLNVAVVVGFLGTGKLSKDEKGMVLMNAWRSACASGAGQRATPIFKQVMATNPSAEFAKEYAAFEMAAKRYNNSIAAMRKAIKMNPHDLENYKVLYQLYKQKGDSASMAKVEQKLVEMEAWEENPGADITSTLQYKQRVRWTEAGDERSPSGLIQFREVDETELQQLEGADE